MDNERTAVITIGDEEYTLLLTTKATKEIAGRYGGLENLGEKLKMCIRDRRYSSGRETPCRSL